jgi:hypothetical protein
MSCDIFYQDNRRKGMKEGKGKRGREKEEKEEREEEEGRKEGSGLGKEEEPCCTLGLGSLSVG